MAPRLLFKFEDLHPTFRDPVRKLEAALRPNRIMIFEGYRTAARQQDLWDTGSTKAKPWHSAHQWGMAVDFATITPEGEWHWPDADSDTWKLLERTARDVGLLRPISWDYGHIQSPYWRGMK